MQQWQPWWLSRIKCYHGYCTRTICCIAPDKGFPQAKRKEINPNPSHLQPALIQSLEWGGNVTRTPPYQETTMKIAHQRNRMSQSTLVRECRESQTNWANVYMFKILPLFIQSGSMSYNLSYLPMVLLFNMIAIYFCKALFSLLVLYVGMLWYYLSL